MNNILTMVNVFNGFVIIYKYIIPSVSNTKPENYCV